MHQTEVCFRPAHQLPTMRSLPRAQEGGVHPGRRHERCFTRVGLGLSHTTTRYKHEPPVSVTYSYFGECSKINERNSEGKDPLRSYFRRAKTKNLYGSSGVRSTTASCATRGGACSLSARSEWCDVATAGTHTYATREREARQFSTARVISGVGGNIQTTPVLRETIDTKPVVWVPDDERAPHR